MALPIIMQQVNAINAFRKSLIGMMLPTTMASLPGGFIEPDGSLILFEDYPEFAEAYQSGKFNNMVLPADASNTDKSNWAGKYVLNAQGTGLYAPRLNGLFLRNRDNSNAVGSYQQDAIQTGFNVIGSRWLDHGNGNGASIVWTTGNVSKSFVQSDDISVARPSNITKTGFYIETSNQRFANETRPVNTSSVYSIYLGNVS